MLKKNKFIITLVCCTSLFACNGTGSANSSNPNSGGTNQSLDFSWTCPTCALTQKNLGWSIVIQNDSDYPYTVQAVPDSSLFNGHYSWENNTELDSETKVPAHDVRVIYGESISDPAQKSFRITNTQGTTIEQIITLHKDDSHDNYQITNDTYKTSGLAIFNHGATKSMATGATKAFIVADVVGLLGGAAISEDIGSDVAKREAFYNAERDLLNIYKFIGKTSEEYTAINTGKATATIIDNERTVFLKNALMLAHPTMTDEQAGLLVDHYCIQDIRKAMVYFRMETREAFLNNYNYFAGKVPIGETGRLANDLDASNVKFFAAITKNSSNAQLDALIGAIGYVASPQTIAIYRAIGGLFGAGAVFGVSNTLSIADKDRVLAPIEIDETGVAQVGQMNNTPAGRYLVTCNNLGSESNVALALCNDKNHHQKLSMLDVSMNLRPQEEIVNNNGVIQGADQYHDYCSYGYNVNGVISAVCKENSNAEAQLQQLDYAHDCADGAEVRFENNRLICSKNRYQYLDSCTPVEVQQPVDDIVTTAQCKGNNGVLREGYSSLDPKLCANGSDIINRDGTLICAQYKPEIPQGSYLNTCRVDFFDQVTTYPYSSTLAASCEDNTGYVSHITLDYLNECVAGSSVSLSSKGFLRCDRYKHYLTTDEVVNLHTQGQDMELQRLYDLGKINY